MNSRGSLIVVSGFSGAGKGTLMKNLVKRSNRYALSVSMTTREPRPGEVDGVSYFFVSKEEFDRTAQEDGFLEHASYVGHSYGTPKAWVLEQMKKGRDVILEIDAQGAKQIKRIMPDAVLVFVVTPEKLRRSPVTIICLSTMIWSSARMTSRTSSERPILIRITTWS